MGCKVQFLNGHYLTARFDEDTSSCYFTYNPMGRITHYTDPEQKVREFLHDPAGDILKFAESQENDGSCRKKYNGTEHLYNAAGNLIERKSDKQHQTFDWDYSNRLTSATNENTGKTTSFSYDALGRRLSKTTEDHHVPVGRRSTSFG